MGTGSNRYCTRGASLVGTLVLSCVLLLLTSPRASADLPFCPVGEGAGQCGLAPSLNGLRGLSVDYETGRLYVADRSNNRVEVFDEDGTFLLGFGWGVADGVTAAFQTCGPEATPPTAQCFKGLEGAGAGQLKGPTKVAVDNVSGSPSRHDIYVVDEGNRRIEKFGPKGEFRWAAGEEGEVEGEFKNFVSVGVGPGGVLYALDNIDRQETAAGPVFKHRLQRFEPNGTQKPPQCILREGGQAYDLGVAADGGFWVSNVAEGNGVRHYDTGCTELALVDTDMVSTALALDENGRVFIGQGERRDKAGEFFFQTIMARDAVGAPISRFGYGRVTPWTPEGLTVGEKGVFLAFGQEPSGVAGIMRLDYPTPPLPPPGPIAVPQSLEVPKVGAAKATAAVEVNPEGDPTTKVHFEYLTRADYEAQGNSFTGGDTEKTLDQPLGAEGFRLKAAEDVLGCPNPSVEALEPVNGCLEPDTEYRWRVVATNGDGPGEGTVEGEPFTTKKSPEILATYATEVGTDTARLGVEVNPGGIPATGYFEYVDDARFTESGFANATKAPDVGAGASPLSLGSGEVPVTRLVTLYPLASGTTYHYRFVAENPLAGAVQGNPEKVRTFLAPEVEPCANDAARIGAGAFLPDCRAYELVSPLDKRGGDIRVRPNFAGGLNVLEQAASSGERLAYGSSRAFSDTLSAPFTSQYIARRVEGKEWETHAINPPRSQPVVGAASQFQSEFKAFSDDLCSAWVLTFAEFPEPPVGFVSGVRNILVRHDRLCGPEAFQALAPRTPVPAKEKGELENFMLELLGLSTDGSHMVFRANRKLDEGGAKGPIRLYETVGSGKPRLVCKLPDGTPFEGNCTAGTESPESRPLPGVVSADGQRIFFSTGGNGARPLYVRINGTETVEVSASPATFWGAAGDGSVAIFSTGELSSGETLFSFDVDGNASTPIATGVRGVMGMSEDAQRIYFASEDVLAGSSQNSEGAEARAGELNLYLYEAGAGTSFIGTLAGADLEAALSTQPYDKRNSRVTPDGAHVAFASIAPLTEYDNVEAGIACGNIVDSGDRCREIYRYDAGADELTCVSCDPTGARPTQNASIRFYASPMHAARMLSNDGSRLYFETADRLAARDSNGKIDVYQWEEEGTGGCGEEDHDFSVASGGCVELISSGQGSLDSRFVESDPSGKNVFFATVSSLLPQDYGLVDIYDAREGGGLPVPPEPAPPCEGDACAPQIAAPDAPSAASEGYAPPAKQKSRKRCRKAKKRGTRAGKARCAPKQGHGREQRRHRRVAR
jgi:NHL repeat